MTQLAQGRKASLVLSPGEAYRVSTPGTVTVTPAYGAPGGVTTITANFAEFGPYDAPAKLELNAVSGSTEYSLKQVLPAATIDVTAAEVASPTAAMLADTRSTYRLATPPYTRYTSDGTTLTAVGSGAAQFTEDEAGELRRLLDDNNLWANKPPPGTNPGQILFISDVGVNGSFWRDNTTEYGLVSSVVVFRQHTSADALETSAAYQEQAGFILPGGVMGTNGSLEILPSWTFLNTATNSKTLQVSFGALSLYAKPRTTTLAEVPYIRVSNRNAANSQIAPMVGIGLYGSTTSSGNNTSGSVNTAADVPVSIGTTWGAAVGGSTATSRLTSCIAILHP